MAIGTTLKIGFDGAEVQRGFASIKQGAASLSSSLAKLSAGTIAAGLAAAGVGAVAFAKGASQAASDVESLETQFGVLLNSTKKAKDLMGQFRNEAAKSPLSTEDYANAGKTILSFGVSSEKVLPALKMLGDVSMGNAERFSSLALAFAQTQASGRLMGQEVLQFVNAGFNPLQVISQKTGRSMKDLKKAMEDGAISADMVTEAFKIATSEGGLFYQALDRGAATTEGKMAKLGDSISQLKVAFGTGFNDGLKVALDAANNYLPQLMDKFKSAGDAIGSAISEAVMGDPTRFQMLGLWIGEQIGSMITSGLKSAAEGMAFEAAKVQEGVWNKIGLGKVTDFLSISKKIGEGSKGFSGYMQESADRRGNMQDMLGIGTKEINGSMYRPARPGESTGFGGLVDENGQKIVRIMEKVEKNTREGAKM